jgi:hypothetical protein
MGLIQPTKLFAVFLSFFGVYFFHAADATAAAFESNSGRQCSRYQSADRRLECASVVSSKLASQAPNKWIPLDFIRPDRLPLVSFEAQSLQASVAFHIIATKKFFLHTGLSPPV